MSAGEGDSGNGRSESEGSVSRHPSRSKCQGVCGSGKVKAVAKAIRPQRRKAQGPRSERALSHSHRTRSQCDLHGGRMKAVFGSPEVRNQCWFIRLGDPRVGVKVHSNLAIAGSPRSVPQDSPAGGRRWCRALNRRSGSERVHRLIKLRS